MEEPLAERVGFEPTVSSRPRRISSAVHSTTLPPLRPGGAKAMPGSPNWSPQCRKAMWSICGKAGH
jgi:hypothetical protein